MSNDGLLELPSGWGFSVAFHGQYLSLISERPELETCSVARVLSVQRGELSVSHPSEVPRRAVLRGRLADAEPCVGDFALVDFGDVDGVGRIEHLFERVTLLQRKRPGPTSAAQPIAANVDLAVVVCALSSDDDDTYALRRSLSLRRVERYSWAIRDAGVRALVAINKADLRTDAEAIRTSFQVALGDVEVVLVSAHREQGLAELESRLTPGSTSVLVGSSGVGKSSLTNRLLGSEQLRTQPAREGDARGRHTTTSRELLRLPSGALLIDTPGMREFGLVAADTDDGIDLEFPDIAAFSSECRFRDCRHEREPGCAVRDAVERGELSLERLDHAHKLERELLHQRQRKDAAARASQRKQERAHSRGVRAILREKRGR